MSTLSPTELKRVRSSNKAVGWILLVAVILAVVFCGIVARNSSNTGSMLATTISVPQLGALQATTDVPASSGLRVYQPECGLNQVRPICRQPFPNESCIANSGMLYGMSVGDLSLYPGSYMPTAFYNTSGYAQGCGECPRCCAGTCSGNCTYSN